MLRFRKKPVEIEAFQMTKERRQDNSEWPNWLNQAWQKEHEEVGSFFPLSTALYIHTLEGNHLVSLDDWIIRGVKGELYPCKPDMFAATYDRVE